MDRRDPAGFSGSQSFYMQQRETSPNLQFQSYPESNTIGGPTLPAEPSSRISRYGVNMGVAISGAPPSEPVKRKRGRPRKYGLDRTFSLALSPSSSTNPGTMTSARKRPRGRPPGSGKKPQLLASPEKWKLSDSAGMGFTPHIITIAIGEDIATKIMSFSEQGLRGVCVLSANGLVSSVTLRQPSSSGATVTFEGHFEIISLSGSYMFSDGDSSSSRNFSGSLSISVASPDGCVIGGGVGGLLIAASPVQVILGSFLWRGSNTKSKNREAKEGVIDTDRRTVDDPMAISGLLSDQQTLITPINSESVWTSMDMSNAHNMDIDLMRG